MMTTPQAPARSPLLGRAEAGGWTRVVHGGRVLDSRETWERFVGRPPASGIAGDGDRRALLELLLDHGSGFGRAQEIELGDLLGIDLRGVHAPRARGALLPSYLSPVFLGTPGAREKFAAWARSTTHPAAPLEPDDVLVRLRQVGDDRLAHVVAPLVARLPRPIGDYAIARCVVIALGEAVEGFCSPPFGAGPWRIVVGLVGGDVPRFERVLVHELCHAWLLPEPDPSAKLLTTFETSTIHDLPMERVPAGARDTVEAMRRQRYVDEEQCEALCRVLGFGRPDEHLRRPPPYISFHGVPQGGRVRFSARASHSGGQGARRSNNL
jgi:hypothetical protein